MAKRTANGRTSYATSNGTQTTERKSNKKPRQELRTDLSLTTDRQRGLTIPCTEEQYEEIIKTLWYGTSIIRKNRTIAVIVQLEANTGLRIGDCMRLSMDQIVFDNGRYRFNMKEHKTGKKRTYTIPTPVYNMLYQYAKAHKIKENEPLFNMTVRNVQKKIDQVTDYLGYKYISTHSFRKRFATRCYEESSYDVNLVRQLLNHSDSQTTMLYLGVSTSKVEKVLKKVVNIVEWRWNDNDGDDELENDPMTHVVSNKYDMVAIKCDIHKDIVGVVDAYCEKADMTLTCVLEDALFDYLKKHRANGISAIDVS